jgi:hypothetical protein
MWLVKIFKSSKPLIFSLTMIIVLSACKESTFLLSGTRYLYVASGACYGGGVTTSTGLATISRIGLDDGQLHGSTINYYAQSPNDQPVGIVNYDSNNLMVLVENTNGRRLDLASKFNAGQISVFYQNATTLSAVGRSLFKSPLDGSVYVAKSTAVEKVSANKQRLTAGAAAYINAPGGACATSTTVMTNALELSGGKLLFSHAAASPNNKIGMISSTGYLAAPDCLTTQAAPFTTSLPTSMLMHSSGKLLVAFGSTTSASNVIMSYTVSESGNSISGATTAYSNQSVVIGPSAMTEDTATGIVYIASATVGAESINAFSFDSSSGVLTRIGSTPFIPQNQYIRCVSGMVVAE